MNTLSRALKRYFWTEDIKTRQLAQEWGVSHATVSRFLNGRPIETKSFLRILNWLLEDDSGGSDA